jgi:hypothetical protein
MTHLTSRNVSRIKGEAREDIRGKEWLLSQRCRASFEKRPDADKKETRWTFNSGNQSRSKKKKDRKVRGCVEEVSTRKGRTLTQAVAKESTFFSLSSSFHDNIRSLIRHQDMNGDSRRKGRRILVHLLTVHYTRKRRTTTLTNAILQYISKGISEMTTEGEQTLIFGKDLLTSYCQVK